MSRVQANSLHFAILLFTALFISSGLIVAQWTKWEISEDVWRVGWGIVVICTILCVWFVVSNQWDADNTAATVPTSNTEMRRLAIELQQYAAQLADHNTRIERLEARPIALATKEPTAQERVIAYLKANPKDAELTTRELGKKLGVSHTIVVRAKRRM